MLFLLGFNLKMINGRNLMLDKGLLQFDREKMRVVLRRRNQNKRGTADSDGLR